MSLIGEVTKVVKLILVSPATNAVSERPFSQLKLLKTHLSSTCGDKQLQLQEKGYQRLVIAVTLPYTTKRKMK